MRFFFVSGKLKDYCIEFPIFVSEYIKLPTDFYLFMLTGLDINFIQWTSINKKLNVSVKLAKLL